MCARRITADDAARCETVRVLRRSSLLVLALAIAGCSSTPRTATNFCRLIDRHRDVLVLVPTSTERVEEVAARYAELLEVAPLAVEADWAALTRLMQQAATVDAADPAAVEALVEASYLTERAANSAAAWVRETCGVDLAAGG